MGWQEWKHKRAVAKLQRQKDIADVAELYGYGLTIREIAARLGRSVAWAHARKEDALRQWREDSNGSAEVRAAEIAARVLIIYREACEAWKRSQKAAERKRGKKRTGTGEGDGTPPGWQEEEIEVKHRDGNPRYLEVALRAQAQLMRLWGLDEQKHVIEGPVNLFQVLLQQHGHPPTWIDEDGREVVGAVEVGEQPKALPAPSDGRKDDEAVPPTSDRDAP